MTARLTKSELAGALGITQRQVENLRRDGMPRIRDGRRFVYPVSAIVWYYKRHLSVLERRAPDYKAARARREQAEAELAELKLAQARGQLMTLDTFRRALQAANERLKAALTTHQRWTNRFLNLSTLEAVDVALRAMMDEIRDVLYRGDDIPDDGDDDES